MEWGNHWTVTRVLGAGAAVGLVMSMSACGGGEAAGDGDAKGKIALSLNGNNEYTQCLATGAMKVLDEAGYDLVVREAGFTTSKELANIENMLTQGVKGLMIQPTTTESAARGAKLAAAQDIPVTGAMAPGAAGLESFIGTVSVAEEQAGRDIGAWLTTNYPEGGEVVVVEGSLGQGRSEAIDDGLDEALSGSGFTIVARQPGDFDRRKAQDIVENALQANPDAKFVVSYAANMGDGIAQYLKESGRDDIVNITRDGDSEMLEWIETPYLTADMYYSAADVGAAMAEQILESIDGGGDELDPFTHEIKETMVTKDTIGDQPPLCYDEYLDEVGLS